MNPRDVNKSQPAEMKPGAVYRRLLSYAWPFRGTFLIGVLGMTLFAATDGALVLFVKQFIDGTFYERNAQVLWLVPIGAPVLFLFRGIGDYMSVSFPGRVGRRVIKAIRADLFRHYLELPTRYYDREGTGHLLSRLTYNVEQVAEAVTKSITSLIRDTLTIAVLISIMVYLNWKLSLFVLVLAPPLSWLIRNVSRSFRRYSGRIQSSMGDVTSAVKEALDGHRVIKVFNAQDAEANEFEKVNEHNRKSNMKLIAARAISNPTVQFIASIGLGGILWVALHQIQNGQLTAGEFMAFIAATLAPRRRSSASWIPSRRCSRVSPPAPASSNFSTSRARICKSGRKPLPRLSGELEFRDVSFEYSSEKGGVLHSVSACACPPARTSPSSGAPGRGKSTLAALVPRFYDVTAGAVLVDGTDVRECNLRDLRHNVALVSQDVLLFNDSIRNNIAFGVEKPDPQAVERAAQMAYVDEFAKSLPQGMDTTGGRTRRAALGRAEAAHRHRARAAQGCAHPDPRRGHLGARQRIRASHPAGAGRAHAQSHHAGDRAPAVHHRTRR